jgi:hypothetical protein
MVTKLEEYWTKAAIGHYIEIVPSASNLILLSHLIFILLVGVLQEVLPLIFSTHFRRPVTEAS